MGWHPSLVGPAERVLVYERIGEAAAQRIQADERIPLIHLINGSRAFMRLAVLLLLLSGSVLFAQSVSLQVPVGTPLPVQLGKHVPMKRGEPLDCRVLYPIYAENQLAIPAGSILRGHVIALHSDRSRRIHGRLWGDFTPFHIPVVHFDQLVLPDGTVKPIVSDNATNGAPVLHLSTPAAKRSHSLFARGIAMAKAKAKSTVALVTAPGRKDRLVQLLYRQLPYHPERIEAKTMWTATLTKPLVLPPYKMPMHAEGVPKAVALPKAASRPSSKSPSASSRIAAAHATDKSAWQLRAYLQQTISSANEKRGNKFQAVVAEPIFRPDHTLAVPQGSILIGTITQAKPARFFGRAGKLRFDFRELKLPGVHSQHVQGTLAGADTAKSQQLQIDSEGGVQSKPQNRVIVPLVLTFLAGRALDQDGNLAGNSAVASNGFGFIGRIVGIVVGSRSVAAGIGFYAAGLSVYELWLVRGQNVVFAKNTRIEVATIPTKNPLSAVPLQQNLPKKR